MQGNRGGMVVWWNGGVWNIDEPRVTGLTSGKFADRGSLMYDNGARMFLCQRLKYAVVCRLPAASPVCVCVCVCMIIRRAGPRDRLWLWLSNGFNLLPHISYTSFVRYKLWDFDHRFIVIKWNWYRIIEFEMDFIGLKKIFHRLFVKDW